MDADVAARHSSGLSAVSSTAQPCVSKQDEHPAVREPRMMQPRLDIFECAWVVRAGRAGWMEASLRRSQESGLSRPPGRRGVRPRRGRVAGPDVSGGKARRVYALVARGARAGVRGATLGLEPPPFTIGIRPDFVMGLEKQGGVSGRWFESYSKCRFRPPPGAKGGPPLSHLESESAHSERAGLPGYYTGPRCHRRRMMTHGDGGQGPRTMIE